MERSFLKQRYAEWSLVEAEASIAELADECWRLKVQLRRANTLLYVTAALNVLCSIAVAWWSFQ